MARTTPRDINMAAVSGKVKFPPKVFNGERGTCVRFVVDSDDSYSDRSGNTKERTVSVDVVSFGDVAERAATLREGDHVVVQAKLQTAKKEKQGTTFFCMELQALAISVPGSSGHMADMPNQSGHVDDLDDDFPL